MIMKPLLTFLLILIALSSCRRQTTDDGTSATGGPFTVEVLNRYTPVKDQGRSPLCWAYAMLAAIETDHLMRGDSVNLSVKYVARNVLMDNYRRYYLTAGVSPFTLRGTGQTLLNSIGRDGLVAYDAYRDEPDADMRVLRNKARRIARKAVTTRAGLDRFMSQARSVVDGSLGVPPRRVYMLGAEYTPQEFARSVCTPDEYVALTSFTHHPFYTTFALEVPDNHEGSLFLNVPVDTLLAVVERAVRSGRGVCWEGDTSEAGFSFARGTADLDRPLQAVSPSHASHTSAGQHAVAALQEARQRAFERFETTDDHSMAIVGLARDRRGRLYFIMKNSWGTDNPYGGLMYVSADYVLMKTIAVYLPREVTGLMRRH